MKQKKLIFNFVVNRNRKKLTDSRKRAKILTDNGKSYHPIETLMKGVGILVVSLRGVNFGFWSQGVLGKTPSYLALKVLFRVAREKYYIVCVLTWSLLGVGKSLGHAQIGLL